MSGNYTDASGYSNDLSVSVFPEVNSLTFELHKSRRGPQVSENVWLVVSGGRGKALTVKVVQKLSWNGVMDQLLLGGGGTGEIELDLPAQKRLYIFLRELVGKKVADDEDAAARADREEEEKATAAMKASILANIAAEAGNRK